MYRRSHYLKKITPFIDKPVIKIIIGMRRVGKSVLMKQIVELLKEQNVSSENILYLNMESLENDYIKNYNDLYNVYLQKFQTIKDSRYILIDEVQTIDNWEKAINSILSEGNTDIYITGSNSTILSSELSTLIAGRYVKFEIFPLSFSEFLLFRDKKCGKPKDEFKKYLRYGGLPAIHYFEMNDDVVYQYINSIYDTILLKDIIERNKIRNVNLLENVYKYIFDNIGNIFTAKKIVDYLKSQRVKVSVPTVQNYLTLLTKTFTAYKVHRYDLKGKRILELYEKYYAGDIGLRNSILGYKDNDIAGLLENIVYLELLKRGYKVNIGKIKELEIDFVTEKNGNIEYYQVSYLLASTKTIEREIAPLKKIEDNYPKYILTLDEYLEKNHEGIIYKNLIDFLLE